MKNYRRFIFILVILLISSLVACTRSASQPSTKPAEDTGTSEEVSGTEEPLGVLEQMATQTAIAMEAGQEIAEEEPVAEEQPVEEPQVEEPVDAGNEGESAVSEEPSAEDEGSTDEEAGGGQEEPAPVQESFDVPNKYVIQKGDHLYCIARRFDINVAALLNANGLSNNSNVYPGTQLIIPKDAGGFGGERSLRNHPTEYTVVAGDTINSIACLFGDVDPRAIEAANELSGDYSLTPGQVLYIP